MAKNPIFYARMEHIEIDYHIVRENVSLEHVITKALSKASFKDLKSKPRVHEIPPSLRKI